MSTTEPDGPSVSRETETELTTEAGAEVQHAEQTEVQGPPPNDDVAGDEQGEPGDAVREALAEPEEE